MSKSDHDADDVRRSLRFARRVVVKAGTPVLTHVDGNIALGRIGAIVEQIAMLRQEGREVVLITSGAISTGKHRMRRSMTLSRSIRDSVSEGVNIDQPAAAAVGQSLIMSMYENLFSKYNMACAQVLITEEDLVSDGGTLAQVCEAVMELLQLGVVPILNENDAVSSRKTPVYAPSTGEIQWDNDMLASKVAVSLRADLMITLTDMLSLYEGERDGGNSKRVSLFRQGMNIVRWGGLSDDALLSDGGRGKFSGRTRMSAEGLKSLIAATCDAIAGGVRTAVVTSGHQPLALLKVVRGDDIGTVFVDDRTAAPKALQSKL